MPAPNRNQWVDLLEAAKERKENAREQFRDWVGAVREEPSLIWQTPIVRYGVYSIGGLMLLLFVNAGINAMAPAGGKRVEPRATTALFDVVCYNSSCGRHFVIERKFRFRRFPVTCPYCKEDTGHRAARCNSQQCHGKLVVTAVEDDTIYCSECGARLGDE